MDTPALRWVRIETEQTFAKALAGKTLAGEGLVFTIHADGRLTGKIGPARLDGRWHWHDGYFCRTAHLDGEDLGLDCEIIEYRPGEMRYTRDKGAGESAVVVVRPDPDRTPADPG